MPSSLSHVVVFVEDLDATVEFLTGIANIRGVQYYETKADEIASLFGWPAEHGATRGAFVGDSPGAVDLLEIPAPLRGQVRPGVRLLAVVNRDAGAAGERASAAGLAVRGPFHTTAATGAPMSLVEIDVAGVPFELVQFSA
jgi:catechol 2,3-dioxygenase-like lactoylglutathione lyase family enzyme